MTVDEAPPTRSFGRAIADVRDGLAHRQLWAHLGWQDIKQRYRRSVLGPIWISITMAVTAVALGILYAGLFQNDLSKQLPNILVGFIIWGFMPVAGPLYPLFFVYFNAYLIAGLHRLLRARRSMTSSFMRNRTLLVVAGVVVSLAGGIVDLTRFIVRWDWLYPPGIPTNAVFALALGIAILRYRLMDVRLQVKRSLVYVSVSQCNHRVPGGETHPDVVQGTATCPHQSADALLPHADPVCDETTALVVMKWTRPCADQLQ